MRWIVLTLYFFILYIPLFAQEPGYVTAVDQAGDTIEGLPGELPDAWLLAFIDVETTGLVPGWHEMIDIGMVYTTVDGDVIDSLFIRILPDHPERASQGAVEVNGFSVDRWLSLEAVESTEAVQLIRDFHQRTAGDKNVLMVAFNSWFDASFLDHLFRTSDGTWREMYYYYVMDIPSMAWTLGFRDLYGSRLSQQLGIPDEPHTANDHTGLTGASLNARIYKALMEKTNTH